MFDPYHKWLGIPREEQPPNHYRLLGLSLFESDPEVIDAAANRQMAYLQVCATGTQALLSQRLLNEVAAARLCLLNPEKKAAYDARLRRKQSVTKEASAPPSPVSEQVPAPSVRRITPDDGYSVLEGIDEEAEVYEFLPIPAKPRRRRSEARKRSILPYTVSILLLLGAVLVFQGRFFNIPPGEIETMEAGPDGNRRGNNQIEGGIANAKVDEVEATREEASRSHARLETLTTMEDGPPGETRQLTGHGWGVLCVAFTPDGKYAVTGSRDRTIRVWDHKSGEEVRRFKGHELGVWGIAITKDQRCLASCSPDSTIRLWDFETGKELRILRGHTKGVRSVLFSRDEMTLISSSSHSEDPTTRLWDAKSGNERRSIFVSGPLALSPDGESILIGSLHSLRIWDQSLWFERWGYGPFQGGITAVAFSPDGKYFASSGGDDYDYSIRLWEASTHNQRRRFVGHENLVNCIAFSPDGKLLLSCSGRNMEPSTDMTIRLWDVESGKEVHRFTGHTQPVKSVVFSPDGKLALSGSEDRTARVWRLPDPTRTDRTADDADVDRHAATASRDPVLQYEHYMMDFDGSNDLARFKVKGEGKGRRSVSSGNLVVESGDSDEYRLIYKEKFSGIESIMILGGLARGKDFRFGMGPILGILNWEIKPENHIRNGNVLTVVTPPALLLGKTHRIELKQQGETVLLEIDKKTIYRTRATLSGEFWLSSAFGGAIFIDQIIIRGNRK
jgi:WD domain, G-beta repeat